MNVKTFRVPLVEKAKQMQVSGTTLNEIQRINDSIVKGAIALMNLKFQMLRQASPLLVIPDLLPTEDAVVHLTFNQEELGHIVEDFDFWIRVNKQIKRDLEYTLKL